MSGSALTPAPARPRSASFRRALIPREVLFASSALIFILLIGAIFTPNGLFFLPATHADALWQISGFGILACGMTIVILSGGIDLSVGSVVALSGVVFSIAAMHHDWPAWAAVSVAVLVGAACGLLNGLMVAFLRLQPFIATLAMMAFARGLAKSNWVSGNVKIQKLPAPEVVEALNTRVPILGAQVSIGVFVFLGCFVMTLVVLQCLRFGRSVYAIGDNTEAALLSGVPVRRTLVIAYTLCGVCAGIAGFLFAALARQGDPDGGIGYELTAIAMVVVGGTSLSGGRGGVTLTLLGALTIGYLRKILDLRAVATPEQLMITGAIIVVAVLLQGFRRR